MSGTRKYEIVYNNVKEECMFSPHTIGHHPPTANDYLFALGDALLLHLHRLPAFFIAR